MAHATLHFSMGLALGMGIGMPSLVRAWIQRRRLSLPYARWFLLAFGLGVVATAPALLRRLGLPDDAWWANIFLAYGLLNRIKPGGQTMGPLVLAALFACQYGVLLAAIARARRMP